MVKKLKQNKEGFEKAPTSNGLCCRFYLKPIQQDYVGGLSLEMDLCKSEVLRRIIDLNKELQFLFLKKFGGSQKK